MATLLARTRTLYVFHESGKSIPIPSLEPRPAATRPATVGNETIPVGVYVDWVGAEAKPREAMPEEMIEISVELNPGSLV